MTKHPTLPPTIGEILKEADISGLCNFNPTKTQQMSKVRFWKTIRANPLLSTSIEDMTVNALLMHSGSKKILDWVDKEPAFLAWFCDEEFETTTIQSMAFDAIQTVYEIMTSPLEEKLLTAKDRLNAANLLLQLADKFPNKRREFVYIDKELGRMGAEDVDRESKRIDGLLSTGKGVDKDS